MGTLKATLLECIVIGAIGTAIGLGANALSKGGVHLDRDYFPRGVSNGQPLLPELDEPALGQSAGQQDPLAKIVAGLKKQGLQVMRHDDVVALFNDPLYTEGLYLIVDARDDLNYESGHIRGARRLDHYRREDHIEAILPLCRSAIKIVTYCNGGECDDSVFTAFDLMEYGIDPAKVFVYPGGMELWKKQGLPVGTGLQQNGQILQTPTTDGEDQP